MPDNKTIKILIACGGTGGHVFPAKALADAVLENYPYAQVQFAGVFKPHLERALKTAGYDIFQAAGRAMPYRFNILTAPSLINMLFSLKKAISILKQYNPDIVVSMGSFSGGPFVVAAKLKFLPVLIHEQNVAPGRANRISAYFADKIATSFDATAAFFPRSAGRKIVCTGNPVRKEILDVGARRAVPLQDRFTILVMGGSQGSHRINEIFVQAARRLDGTNFRILHFTGDKDLDFVKNCYTAMGIGHEAAGFCYDMASAYAESDLVICRSGATSIAEITLLGLAAILVPYPYGDAHQKENADMLKKADAAVIIEEEGLTKDILFTTIQELSENKEKLSRIRQNSRRLARPDAAQRLAREVISLL